MAAAVGVYLDCANVRSDYHKCNSKILEVINNNSTICAQAQQVFDLRNNCRIQARKDMNFRPLAWYLDSYEKNLVWEDLYNRASKKYNVSEDAVCQEILKSSQRTRKSVDGFLSFGVWLLSFFK